ncbi:DUF6318 family protein [Specibacter cremeus]|uniref:DUF6318 family protein n=1 Tax=Specibacter cremeus TaxID=1629051 RepID=UPI000F78F6BB|nr:DUF6318 family protein [Specibacter cremeus]
MTPMMAITVPECETCAKVKETVEDVYGEGGWITGGKMTVLTVNSTLKASDGLYNAIASVRQDKAEFFDANGMSTKRYGTSVARADAVVAIYSGGKWSAQSVGHISAN